MISTYYKVKHDPDTFIPQTLVALSTGSCPHCLDKGKCYSIDAWNENRGDCWVCRVSSSIHSWWLVARHYQLPRDMRFFISVALLVDLAIQGPETWQLWHGGCKSCFDTSEEEKYEKYLPEQSSVMMMMEQEDPSDDDNDVFISIDPHLARALAICESQNL